MASRVVASIALVALACGGSTVGPPPSQPRIDYVDGAIEPVLVRGQAVVLEGFGFGAVQGGGGVYFARTGGGVVAAAVVSGAWSAHHARRPRRRLGILSSPARLILALPLTLTAAGTAFAQQGPFELGAFGTLASFAPSFNLRMGLAGGGRFGYRWRPGWAFEFELGAGSATIDRHTWYVLAGYARPGFRGTPPGRFSDDAITLGLGRQTGLRMRLALRTELRGLYTFSSGRTGRGAGHLFASVGLSFYPGSQSAADADSDGVSDRRDGCLRTPVGAFVDPRGCPADSDGDGRLDGLDRCPNTPAGVLTDSTGCPIDADRDGVYDGVDQCPDSPVGSGVDLRGCPLDTDRDGVNDAADRCPRTPPSALVDASGCPVTRDTDGDRVNDAYDRCPGTAGGTVVDALGCHVLFPGARDTLVLEGVRFESGSSRLVTTSFAILDQVAASLLAHPELRIEIAGYSDNTGSVTTNTQLSAARARAVLAYLSEHGVAAERMRAVASNATPEGRERNRRVELHRVS